MVSNVSVSDSESRVISGSTLCSSRQRHHYSRSFQFCFIRKKIKSILLLPSMENVQVSQWPFGQISSSMIFKKNMKDIQWPFMKLNQSFHDVQNVFDDNVFSYQETWDEQMSDKNRGIQAVRHYKHPSSSSVFFIICLFVFNDVIWLKATKHAEREQISLSHWLKKDSRAYFIGWKRFPKHHF